LLAAYSARKRAEYEKYRPAFAEFLGGIVQVQRGSLEIYPQLEEKAAAEGRVEASTFETMHATARCVQPKLVGLQGPKPPFAPFHVFVDMRIAP
jgi:hypothetical protein